MPLQISAFRGGAAMSPVGGMLQVVQGAPAAVSVASFTGAYTVPIDCSLVKIQGVGTIAWPGLAQAEVFDGVEFRGVRAGDVFTVA